MEEKEALKTESLYERRREEKQRQKRRDSFGSLHAATFGRAGRILINITHGEELSKNELTCLATVFSPQFRNVVCSCLILSTNGFEK